MNRRRAFVVLASFLPFARRAFAQANAHISTTDPLVFSFTKGASVMPGRVTLELPLIADTGFSVPMTVRVDSPMTDRDYVKTILLLAERNPVRDACWFYLGPRTARAEVASRIRLNGSQRVVAIAELSDGTFWSAARPVEVREAACTESE
ncbi:MAG TPA: thiosulfate oxidation carrier protein SoxY [Burkholderiales bacterium]|nr:thiosulfate oxidation carrier protein SoxY [Burkholderiales bacterium]